MCGIAGVVHLCAGAVDIRDALARMSESLRHRGPDDSSTLALPELGAGLAFRRLALVDLVTGRQPIANEDETIYLVANAEIYNHQDLRRELVERGHRFRTRTDVEVILHLYEELGVDCLARLNGMFGLAILDLRSRRLVLARDRAGMKPLYYADTESGFLFASEPGALLASGMLSAAPDWAGLDSYLAVGYTPAPRTCFQGVRKVKAGAYLVVEENATKERSFWRLRFQSPASSHPKDERDLAAELEELLRKAVATHLAADVPVGAFVSGGWDSSLVAAMAAKVSPGRLQTFSIVFPDHPALDEGRFARLLASQIGSEHHEISLNASDIPAILPKAVRRLGEPCLASPALLFYQLSSLAASRVKAVVGGEGSDELFAGYDWLQRRSDLYYWLRPFVPRSLVRAAAGRVDHLQFGRALRVLGAAQESAADAEWYRIFSPAEQRELFVSDPGSERLGLDTLRLDQETEQTCRNRLERRLSLEFTRRLPEGILLVADRMSMAHSLEVRMPFLDASVLEYAAALPASMKRRGSQEKYVLSLLTGLIPDGIARRKKFGLKAPMKEYLKGPLRGFVRDLLLDSSRLGGLLDRGKLESALDRWIDGSDPYVRQPWSLVVLQTWWNEYFGS